MATEVPEYEIRLMRKEDIPDVLDLWRETGYLEGTHCINTWFKYDPEGFYVAVAKDGTVLGSCAGVLQNKDLAFIGLYAVKSTFQRRGIGRKIWNKVMERIGDRNAGVNPVPEMLENYRDRAGFPIQCDWLSIVCVAKEVSTSEMISELPGVEVSIVQHDEADIEKAVTEYDAQVFGFHRGSLISILCHERDSITVVATKSIDSSICGYGNVKKNIKGNALVGPLYADDNCIAELILYHLVRNFPTAQSKGVTLMPIGCNEDALEMVERLGFEKVVENARLYRSEEVNVQFNKVFALHNLNFSVF